jgi:hypothetical protein
MILSSILSARPKLPADKSQKNHKEITKTHTLKFQIPHLENNFIKIQNFILSEEGIKVSP